MSIRLRLTLLYSAIVALTVIAFSVALYVAQSESTLNAIRGELAQQAERFANAPHLPDNRGGDFPPPGNTLPGRWTQLRSVDGTITAHTADLISTTLPLSDAGLLAVQSGSTWSETALIEEGAVLIYSQPTYYQGGMAGIVQVAAPISEREQSLGNLRFILLIGSSLVIVAAFAIGWALGGTALSPIQRITQTAQAIGAERNFSRRVEHVGPADEVGQLATTINR